MKMQKKRNTFLKLLKFEKDTLEERIERLLKEKKEVSRQIEKTKFEKMIVDLKQGIGELEERIKNLERERKTVIRDMQVVEFMGELKCPKDFQCYKRKYEKLCKTEYFGETKILHCLEEAPQSCTFALSYKDTYYCQCPLRIFIAEEMGK
jgi:predicted RNase H-like nuclease (RuvC/YqgF family)